MAFRAARPPRGKTHAAGAGESGGFGAVKIRINQPMRKLTAM